MSKEVCGSFMESQGCLTSASMLFLGSSKDITRIFQKCVKPVLSFLYIKRVFKSFNGVSRKFQRCFMAISRWFQGSLKEVLPLFKEVA